MRIYGFLRPEQRAVLAEREQPDAINEWDLPVWLPELPALAEGDHAIFRAANELDDDARRGFFYAFIALANKIAVADKSNLGDAETLPDTIEKAAQVASLGLEHISAAHSLSAEETLRRTPLERLFRVGVNLAPESVRPAISED